MTQYISTGFKGPLPNFVSPSPLPNFSTADSVFTKLPIIGYNQTIWNLLSGVTGLVLGYAGYKIFRWFSHEQYLKEVAYEYKYETELDELLDGQMDDLNNPEMKDQDTIKIGSSLFSLNVFKSFSRNYRKKLVRRSDEKPRVKRVAVPADEFDWSNTYVSDETPRGDVAMRYCPDSESFWYYSDSANIPYKYLETVARKYVCENNRLDVFVDVREELKKGYAEMKKLREEDAKAVDAKDSDNNNDNGAEGSRTKKQIYAKFKSYNKKTARAAPNAKKGVVVVARANRYSYKGKFDDYQKLNAKRQNSASVEVIGEETEKGAPTPDKVSYTEWLKINGHEWK